MTTTTTATPLDGAAPGRRNPIIETVSLTKTYAGTDFRAVDGLNLRVGTGEVFGLLGPNGAGKTTTIGVLTTRVIPTGGQALIGGIDVVRAPDTRQAADRRGVPAEHVGPPAHALREPLLARAPLRDGSEGVAADRRRPPRAVPADALRQGVGLRPLRRDGPAPHGGPRHLPPAGRPLPRRAHRRARPPGTARAVGAARGPQRRGPDHHAHHALHGRSRQALRPRGDHGPRQDPRPRHAGRPEAQRRRRHHRDGEGRRRRRPAGRSLQGPARRPHTDAARSPTASSCRFAVPIGWCHGWSRRPKPAASRWPTCRWPSPPSRPSSSG